MRIVHVEDEPLPADWTKRFIERTFPDAEFFQFTSAEAALEFLNTNPTPPVDIILTDYNLMRGGGHLNGAQMAIRLHEQGSQIPVVMIAATPWSMVQKENPTLGTTPDINSPINKLYNKRSLTLNEEDLQSDFSDTVLYLTGNSNTPPQSGRGLR